MSNPNPSEILDALQLPEDKLSVNPITYRRGWTDAINAAKEALLHPTTNSGKGETKITAVEHPPFRCPHCHQVFELPHACLIRNPTTPVDDKAGDKEHTR